MRALNVRFIKTALLLITIDIRILVFQYTGIFPSLPQIIVANSGLYITGEVDVTGIYIMKLWRFTSKISTATSNNIKTFLKGAFFVFRCLLSHINNAFQQKHP